MIGLDVPEEFVRPDFREDIDPGPWLAAVPSGARCKGMFMRDIVHAVRSLAPEREREHFSATSTDR